MSDPRFSVWIAKACCENYECEYHAIIEDRCCKYGGFDKSALPLECGSFKPKKPPYLDIQPDPPDQKCPYRVGSLFLPGQYTCQRFPMEGSSDMCEQPMKAVYQCEWSKDQLKTESVEGGRVKNNITTTDQFEKILKSRLEKIQSVLGKKACEYAQNGDRLFNFRLAAQMNDESMPKALWGMATKHLVSVKDLIDGRLEATPAMVDEKVGDMINYLILLEAVFTEGNNADLG